jgi:tRNA A37 threonylcarbamoyladenosine biosynthesis protein TsaE
MRVESCGVKEMKRTEEVWCIEWKEDIEHKAQKKKGTEMHT